ncbi:MAG: hypothetical protein ACREFB_19115 [Stellaceae bacterium]
MDRIAEQPATSGNRARWRCRAVVVSAALLALSMPLGGGALAADHDFHRGGAGHSFHGHNFHGGAGHASPVHGAWHGGHAWHGGGVARRGGHDRGREGFGWGGFGWGAPDYGDWYDWSYPGYYEPPGYAYSAPAANVWYYCYNPAGYYPYVQQCYGAWQPVPAG